MTNKKTKTPKKTPRPDTKRLEILSRLAATEGGIRSIDAMLSFMSDRVTDHKAFGANATVSDLVNQYMACLRASPEGRA